jgi:glycosyltransferase involved in cell wall biosynthesis
MAAGKPFVATAVGGVPEMLVSPIEITPGQVSRGQNGFSTAPAVSQIARCFRELVEDRELGRVMGRRGREYALATFGCERLALELRQLYEELLREEQSHRTALGVRTTAPQ